MGPLLPGEVGRFFEIWDVISPSQVFAATAALAAVWLLLPLLWPQKGKAATAASPVNNNPAAALLKAAKANSRNNGPSGPNIQGTFIPPTGLIEGNAPSASSFETELVKGSFLGLHRPTYDKALDKSGDYPYGSHFKGRKRLWEMRLSLQPKVDVTRPLRFGIQLEQYVPLNAATKRMMGITVAALRQVAGSDLYHSPGDDPEKTDGELEPPTFSMPLWAFDQLIVTPEGEEPPDLSDEHFCQFGRKRADDRNAFIKEISELEIKAGNTYTFAFWGISQFLDDIKWEVQKVIPFKSIDFNLFCGAPPVHIVVYTLNEESSEARHLEHRKNYFFRIAFWSSLKQPAPERLRQLLPDCQDDHQASSVQATAKKKGWSSKVGGLFACCAETRTQRMQ